MELIHTLHEPDGAGPQPTILALHGRGANALDLLGLAPFICGGKFLVICPQGPLETPIGPNAMGYSWYPMSMGGPPDVEAILGSRKRLQQFLDECVKRYPIDPRKLALLGFSQGGVMAHRLPEELLPRLSVSNSVQSLPTLVQHGSEDPMIQVGRARDSVERLRQLRVPLTYREYDMGHEITPKSLTDLSAWLEEKVLSPIVIAR